MTPAGEILRQMRRLPFADLDAIAPGVSLILAPHPDDEVLGCGGFVIEASKRGRPPLIVAVTDGAGSHPGSIAYPPERLKGVRAAELRSAAQILGVPKKHIRFLNLPDTRAPREGPEFERAVRAVGSLIRHHSVTNLLASWTHDPHGDHQATACIASKVAQIVRIRLLFYRSGVGYCHQNSRCRPVWSAAHAWMLVCCANRSGRRWHLTRRSTPVSLPIAHKAFTCHPIGWKSRTRTTRSS